VLQLLQGWVYGSRRLLQGTTRHWDAPSVSSSLVGSLESAQHHYLVMHTEGACGPCGRYMSVSQVSNSSLEVGEVRDVHGNATSLRSYHKAASWGLKTAWGCMDGLRMCSTHECLPSGGDACMGRGGVVRVRVSGPVCCSRDTFCMGVWHCST
jgi:hypothetical protein